MYSALICTSVTISGQFLLDIRAAALCHVSIRLSVRPSVRQRVILVSPKIGVTSVGNFVSNSGFRKISPRHVDRRRCCPLCSTDDCRQFIALSAQRMDVTRCVTRVWLRQLRHVA